VVLRLKLHSVVIMLLLFIASSRGETIYVGTDESKVWAFAPDGTRSVFASSGLNGPSGLAFDASGNLYVASYNNSIIMKFSPQGVGTAFASTGLNHPAAMAFDSAGNLFVANGGAYDPISQQYHSYIEKFTPGGIGSLFVDATGRDPSALVFDRSGNLYAAYRGNQPQIVRFSQNGVGSVFASTGRESAQGLAFDSTGNLYASYGLSTQTIEKFSSTGLDLGAYVTGAPNPAGLVFDSSDNLYAANYIPSASYIEKITPDGARSVFASQILGATCIAIIPEPSMFGLIAFGWAAWVFRAHRKRNGARVSLLPLSLKPTPLSVAPPARSSL
jgi:sugar lactone lactonase YvrE